jgi:hypothetical protein
MFQLIEEDSSSLFFLVADFLVAGDVNRLNNRLEAR